MSESQTVTTIRQILLVILVGSLVGVEVELLLLGHLKPFFQLVPFVVSAVALASIAWYGFSRAPISMRIFQGTMYVCVISGFLGIFLHFGADVSAATKKNPNLQGFELLREALGNKAPPLAPAAMIQIGLLGLAYTFRHPALDPDRGNSN